MLDGTWLGYATPPRWGWPHHSVPRGEDAALSAVPAPVLSLDALETLDSAVFFSSIALASPTCHARPAQNHAHTVPLYANLPRKLLPSISRGIDEGMVPSSLALGSSQQPSPAAPLPPGRYQQKASPAGRGLSAHAGAERRLNLRIPARCVAAADGGRIPMFTCVTCKGTHLEDRGCVLYQGFRGGLPFGVPERHCLQERGA